MIRCPAIARLPAAARLLPPLLLLAGCVATPADRIAKNPELFAALPVADQDRIRLGQSLVIPAFKDKKPYVAPSGAGDALSFAGRHVVAKGDTLWSLSLRYGVQPEVLAAKNGMALTSVLREGLALSVPILE